MSSTFTIRSEQFEGPIDLLLTLIEKRQLHINDVSLASVADEYIAHIQSNESIHPGDTANFLIIASTLLLIKSLSLLPGLPVTPDEESSIEELELRLKILQDIRRKSEYVLRQYCVAPIFERDTDKGYFVVFSPSKDLTLETLKHSILGLVKSFPKFKEVPHAIVQKMVSLEQVISNLTERIQKNLQMSFSDFMGKDKSEKITVVVGFLAVLELVKQGVILVRQQTHLSDIEIETNQFGVPSYGSE